MKKEMDHEPVSGKDSATEELSGIQKENKTDSRVFICDECGDTLWDAVLEQNNKPGK